MTSAGAEFERYEQELIDRGIGTGKAQMLLRILQARGLPVSEEVRSRILSCSDTTAFDLWADRALFATSAEDIFATG